jgi:rhodanese-related sulfurtransferase
VARTLHNSGYTNMKILHGGYDAWKAAGGQVEEKQ